MFYAERSTPGPFRFARPSHEREDRVEHRVPVLPIVREPGRDRNVRCDRIAPVARVRELPEERGHADGEPGPGKPHATRVPISVGLSARWLAHEDRRRFALELGGEHHGRRERAPIHQHEQAPGLPEPIGSNDRPDQGPAQEPIPTHVAADVQHEPLDRMLPQVGGESARELGDGLVLVVEHFPIPGVDRPRIR